LKPEIGLLGNLHGAKLDAANAPVGTLASGEAGKHMLTQSITGLTLCGIWRCSHGLSS
jgi:hypothetical protein